jgi:hypothetical protein
MDFLAISSKKIHAISKEKHVENHREMTLE